jgi:hypothetical protein
LERLSALVTNTPCRVVCLVPLALWRVFTRLCVRVRCVGSAAGVCLLRVLWHQEPSWQAPSWPDLRPLVQILSHRNEMLEIELARVTVTATRNSRSSHCPRRADVRLVQT